MESPDNFPVNRYCVYISKVRIIKKKNVILFIKKNGIYPIEYRM